MTERWHRWSCTAALACLGCMALLAAQSTYAATADAPQAVLPPGCVAAGDLGAPAALPAAPAGALLPAQLRMEVPVPPAAVPSAGASYLFYEVHLQNYGDDPLALRTLEVISGAANNGRVLASVPAQVRALGPHAGTVMFVCLAMHNRALMPSVLRHRVLLADGSAATGPDAAVDVRPLPVLGPPLAGPGWTAANGPSLESHHRTGVLVLGGQPWLARRFAIDWKKYRNGKPYVGDPRDPHAYFAYGEPVFAVAGGTVVVAVDGRPDNVPRTAAGLTPAVPLTLDNLGGNNVVLDLGHGVFATYAHLQPGSVQVRPGDRVRRGQWVGRIGSSGDAREPHLHFQLTNGPDILASEGLPYVLDGYWTVDASGARVRRRGEFPAGEPVVDFAGEGGDDKLR